MPFDAYYLEHIPGAVTMVFLVSLIVLLRRRYPRLDTGTWLVTNSFILASQFAWFIQPKEGALVLHLVHVVILLGQMLAGVALLFYEHEDGAAWWIDRVWVIVNTLPLVAFVSIYGFYVEGVAPYLWVAGVGLVVLGVSSWWRRTKGWLVLAGMLPLVPAAAFSAVGWDRMAGYWVLAAVYALVLLHLRKALRPGSIGRLPIMTSMVLWVVIYASHAWLFLHPFWRLFVDEIWSFEKYLLAIGMLLMLLEDQVVVNQHLALHDALTGLPNRRSLLDWMEKSIRQVRREGGEVTLVMVDLNGFKRVNDTYGHLAGDHLLLTVARRMLAVVDSRDLLVRLGGDEFVLASTRGLVVERLKEKLGEAIREPVEAEGYVIRVDGCFGVARFPEDVTERDMEGARSALLRVADARMYENKAGSRE